MPVCGVSFWRYLKVRMPYDTMASAKKEKAIDYDKSCDFRTASESRCVVETGAEGGLSTFRVGGESRKVRILYRTL